MEFTLDCTYCDPAHRMLRLASSPSDDEALFKAQCRAMVTPDADGNTQIGEIHCNDCGADFKVEPDDADFICSKDVSRPEITGVVPTSNTAGSNVQIDGTALDIGDDFKVFFGPVEATVIGRNASYAVVVTPPAMRTLKIGSIASTKLTLTFNPGHFDALDAVTCTSSGATGVVLRGGEEIWVSMTSGSFAVGDLIQSGSKVGTVDAITHAWLQAGETLTGESSGATGVLTDPGTMLLRDVTGQFQPNEIVVGGTSGAAVKLAPDPFDSVVDVRVENGYGRRPDGDTLSQAFTYL
jgi:hypothetical protein